MGNQAEHFEGGNGAGQYEDGAELGLENGAAASPKALPELTIATDSKMNGDKKGQSKPSTSGFKSSPNTAENVGGDPNLVAPQYEGDEEHAEGEHKEVNEGEDKSSKDQHDRMQVALGEAKRSKKKKKGSKSKSKRGKAAPTGFEEFYVDAPVQPAEFEEEKGLYDESVPFAERIQTAIQRYSAKRILNSERKDVFDKYMSYGGISSGPKMFAGVDAKKLDGTAAEIAALKATNFVPLGRGGADDPDFVVDFEGCAKGFFSSRLPSVYELTEQRIQLSTTVIRNFLNYVHHHNVCTEYNDQIIAARSVCDRAEKELSHLAKAQAILPGDFNRACSNIFGGCFQDVYVGNQEWAKGVEIPDQMSPETARQVFKIALAAQASEEIWEKYTKQSEDRSIQVISTFDAHFEVTELIPPNKETLNIYKTPNGVGVKPVGMLRAKKWFDLNDYDRDLTVEEETAEAAARAIKEASTINDYEFWVDDELLQLLHIGMKISAKVHQTSFGLQYFDSVQGAYCSFYTVLPNELMIGWREPGPPLPYRKPYRADELKMIPGGSPDEKGLNEGDLDYANEDEGSLGKEEFGDEGENSE